MILEHSDAKQSKTPYIISVMLFLFSLLYLYSEFIFNALMLDVAGTSFSSMEQIEDVQYYGRMVSANGFTLLLLGLFAKSGFRLWWMAGVCMLICSIPLVMIFGESLYRTMVGGDVIEAGFDPEMGWALMIIPGIFLLLQSGGHNRALVALGLIIMAWPAMFFGQKLIVERYIIAPTTWEERLGARYVLMARSKSEECLMKLGEIDTCRAYMRGEDVRSLNAILAAVMLNARQVVLSDVGRKKNEMLLNEVLRVNSDKTDRAYQLYLNKIYDLKTLAYNQYKKDTQRFVKYFYMPYLQASRRYERRDILSSKMIAMLDGFEDKKSKAWSQYEIEASNYNTAISAISGKLKDRLTQFRKEAYDCDNLSCEKDKLRTLRYFQKEHSEDFKTLERMCGGNPLEYNCKLTKEDIAIKLHEKKDPEFIKKSGYRPDIKTQAAFFALSKNNDIIRKSVESTISKAVKGIDFDNTPLPNNITRETLEVFLKSRMGRYAEIKWMLEGKKRFGKFIPPGLPLEDFFKALDIKMPKNIGKSFPVLNKKEFMELYILPQYKAQVVTYFDEIEKEAPLYANQEKLSRQGKNYIRAIYIPPIAIGLSLLIVALTIGKNIIFISSSLLRIFIKVNDIPSSVRAMTYTMSWLMFIGAMLWFFGGRENTYIQNETYQRYYKASYSQYPITAVILDGIIRIQPTIYRQGNLFLAKAF